jgi:hypothetical protein
VTIATSSSAKDITAFSFASPPAVGVITGTNIAVTVPYGTNVTALVASFTTTGVSVKVGTVTQISGSTANNFTSPVTYTVTAADASAKTYTVTVMVATNSSAKDITSFSFANPPAVGVITGTDIVVTVPYGTNVTGLVASFTTTGVSVKIGTVTQVSGTTANNFSDPVTYTVTAADASTKTYTVTVIVTSNSAKNITSFYFTNPSATGVITGSNIVVTVPYGTNVTALVASFTTTGVSVKVGTVTQVSGTTPNNFTTPVVYMVTAADASTKNYTVTVKVATETAKEITTFYFTNPAAKGVITGTKIAVTVPYGTDVTALVATFTTTGASVKVGTVTQVSGTTPNNFTNPLIYTVTAADASTRDYTVTVTVAALRTMSYLFRSNGLNDGWILESSEDSNQGGSANDQSGTLILGDDASDRQYRSIIHFPTYYLPDNAVVTPAILMIKKKGLVGTDPFTTHQNVTAVDMRNGLFGGSPPYGPGSLQVSDFQAPASMDSAGMIQNNPVGDWYSVVLDSSSYQVINLRGITQLRLMFQLDDDDDQTADYLTFFSGDAPNVSDRPRLLVTYTYSFMMR